jgi:hypothetical protein
MSAKERRMSEIIGRLAISEGEKKKRAQRMSYNERSEEGWYLDTPRKTGLHSNMLTLPAVEVTIFLPQRPRIRSHSEGLSTGPAGGSSKTRRRALWVTQVGRLVL